MWKIYKREEDFEFNNTKNFPFLSAPSPLVPLPLRGAFPHSQGRNWGIWREWEHEMENLSQKMFLI